MIKTVMDATRYGSLAAPPSILPVLLSTSLPLPCPFSLPLSLDSLQYASLYLSDVKY